jgi:hypothetical protein
MTTFGLSWVVFCLVIYNIRFESEVEDDATL